MGLRTEEALDAQDQAVRLFPPKATPSRNRAAGDHRFPYGAGRAAPRQRLHAKSGTRRALVPYREVLGGDPGWLDGLVRANRPQRLPMVLGPQEVRTLFAQLSGVKRLKVVLLHGSALRRFECCRLYGKDLDFERSEFVLRDGKGNKDRVTMPPAAPVREPLRCHFEQEKQWYEQDLKSGSSGVPLPSALHRKYPHAAKDWAWSWVFPASKLYIDTGSSTEWRYHLHESVLQKAIKDAVAKAGIAKPASRHSADIPPLHTLWRMGTTSGQFKSFWTQGFTKIADDVECPLRQLENDEELGEKTVSQVAASGDRRGRAQFGSERLPGATHG